MLFFYLLLAHFVSDYLLQPNDLVEWKRKSKKGLIAHGMIHFLFSSMVLLIYTGNTEVIALTFLLSCIHIIIDKFKSEHDKKNKNTILSYWVDQVGHYISILILTLIAWQFNGVFVARSINVGNYCDSIFFNPAIIIYISVAIFSTLTIEYAYFRKTKPIKTTLNIKNMIRRLFWVTLVYIGLLFAAVPSVGVYFGG